MGYGYLSIPRLQRVGPSGVQMRSIRLLEPLLIHIIKPEMNCHGNWIKSQKYSFKKINSKKCRQQNMNQFFGALPHLPLVPRIYVSDLGSTGSGNGLAPVRRQAST